MKKYLVLGLLVVLTVLFAIPLSAEEKVKVKLPDGLYMYNSSIERLQNGRARVGFGKYFVVKNNIIYSSKEAVKKIGISKLNKSFTENKNYKILLSGEKVGEIHNVIIYDDENWNYDDKGELLIKNIKEGPMYGVPSIYLGRLGSAVKCMVVPEEYQEQPKKVFNTISQEEVDKISKLAKDKLYPLVENKIYKTCKILDKDSLGLLDKISDRNGELYIGIYRFVFKGDNRGYCDNQIIFSTKNDDVRFITSRHDDNFMTICGMLDIEGDGEGELIIERTFLGEDADDSKTIVEMYKQKEDGNWTLIHKIK